MKNQTLTLLALLILGLTSAQAQNATPFQVGLGFDQQHVKSQSATFTENGITEKVGVHPKKNYAPSIQFSYNGWTFGPGDLGITACYRFNGKSDLYSSLDTTSKHEYGKFGELTHSSSNLGLQYVWRKPLDLGLGLQWRMEKLKADSVVEGGPSLRGNYNRPWMTASAGYTFLKGQNLQPFVSLNMAIPLQSKKLDINDDSDKHFLQCIAPKFEMGLQAGIRF